MLFFNTIMPVIKSFKADMISINPKKMEQFNEMLYDLDRILIDESFNRISDVQAHVEQEGDTTYNIMIHFASEIEVNIEDFDINKEFLQIIAQTTHFTINRMEDNILIDMTLPGVWDPVNPN